MKTFRAIVSKTVKYPAEIDQKTAKKITDATKKISIAFDAGLSATMDDSENLLK